MPKGGENGATHLTMMAHVDKPRRHHPALPEPRGAHLMGDASTAWEEMGLARPARRALLEAGYSRIEQLAAVSEDELRRLHGMGPKALDLLRRALA